MHFSQTSATSWQGSLFSLHSELNNTLCDMKKIFKNEEKNNS